MKKLNRVTMLTYERLIYECLNPLPDLNLVTTNEPPWHCSTCGEHRAAIDISGSPACLECHAAPVDNLVPGPRLDLSRAWKITTARWSERALGVVAVVAGAHLVSPLARARFKLGIPADDFRRELSRLVAPVLGFTRDAYGIWRRQDGSRLDGTDAMDLVLGIPGVWSPEQIRRFEENDPVDAQVRETVAPSADGNPSRLHTS